MDSGSRLADKWRWRENLERQSWNQALLSTEHDSDLGILDLALGLGEAKL